MIDGCFSVLVISLIVALGGLAALLVQSYREGSFQCAEEPHLLPWHGDRHRPAKITSVLHKGCMSHISTSAAIEDASAVWRELLDGVKTQCGMALTPGERLRILALDDGASCRLGKIFKQDGFIDSVRAARERRKQ
jgi:hypothetical protein